MSYEVKWSSTGMAGGKQSIVVAERTFNDTSTSLTLTGKGLNNYGLFQQENFLRLLENFAHYNAPPAPTTGQLWYDTGVGFLKIWDGEWKNVCADSAFGLNDYSPDPDPNTLGFANRLNRVIGSPVANATTSSAYGWGQTDFVPTYTSSSALDTLSATRANDLPVGETFPATFNNNAWAIAISRLRKALRQTGLDETETSSIGFINDGLPGGTGNSLANLYNDNPARGTMADILAGFGGLGTFAIQAAYVSTEAALDKLETYRFSLGPLQAEVNNVGGEIATDIPTGSMFLHTAVLSFPNETAANAFFNAGGQIKFEMSFTPSAGIPSEVENAWNNFLKIAPDGFSGICLDYQGVKTDSSYSLPTISPTYLPVVEGGSSMVGFYGLTGTIQPVFARSVMDSPLNPGIYDPDIDGGVTIRAKREDTGSSYDVTVEIEFIVKNIDDYASFASDPTLNGVLESDIVLYYASDDNCNSPTMLPPTVNHSSTITPL